jgi:RNA-directed DNA polymerase
VKNQVIYDAIVAEAEKLVRRHQMYASDLASRQKRVERRTGQPQTKDIKFPQYWAADDGFNPYTVRARSKQIAHAVSKALDGGNYKPRPAVEYSVPKKDGGQRAVSVFQVADNAISRLTFERLLDKNARHFSAHAYAYRKDLTIHDAVLHIAADLHHKSRVFIAEFDFRKFFDSISHEHIERVLLDRRFFITSRELQIIRAFLQAPTFPLLQYNAQGGTPREKGIPQGTSISLFLANVAAYPLDRKLEDLGVGFARYADDTLIWAENYSKICEAVGALEEIGFEMGVELNFNKSEGISILCPDSVPAEFKRKPSVSFVGYEISSETISMRLSTLSRAKNRLSYLIYSNLLQAPKKGQIVPARVAGSIDLDYVVMLYQIRRYLYGELSEGQLRRFMARQTPLIKYHGLMSFYPIIDDEPLLKELDGWLLGSVDRALRLRARLLGQAGIATLPEPHGKSKRQLLALRHKSGSGPLRDLRFPSIARIARLMRRAARTYGASTIANPQSAQYYSP